MGHFFADETPRYNSKSSCLVLEKFTGDSLFSKENAIAFVDECKIYKVNILGIDAFYLYDNNQIQPSLEDSIEARPFSAIKWRLLLPFNK